MENWNHLYSNKGQALLELAVFGSLLIMLLGILINYGLRYNFQQQVMQQAFRKALASAAESVKDGKPSAVSYVLIKDRHIPDPSSPFGVGSVMPVSASAGVTRNYKTQEVAGTVEELPRVIINIQGQEFDCLSAGSGCTTAGFRYEKNVPEDSKDKYAEIYGSSNVCWDEDCGATEGELDGSKNIKIIDSCAGEIIDYNSAVRQCRQIVDEEVCKKECERGKFPGSETDCNKICSQTMNVPWYCQGYQETDTSTHKYTFSALNQLFVLASGHKAMGVQPDYTKVTTINNSLNKTEDSSGIATKDNIDWQDETKRTIVYRPYGDASGNTIKQEVKTSVSQKKTKVWNTGW